MQTTVKRQASFPEVGKIRKGAAKSKQGYVGKDLNERMRVVFDPGNDDLEAKFISIYGTLEPPKIHAMLPYNLDLCWSSFNEAYSTGRQVALADDHHFLMKRHPITGEYEVRGGEPYIEYHPGMCIEYQRGKKKISLPIKPHNRLKLFLPELQEFVFLTLVSTSFYDREAIAGNLAAIQLLANNLNGGNVAGIPIYIYRVERSIVWNKTDGSAARVNKWIFAIKPDAAWTKNAIARLSKVALGSGPALLAQSSDIVDVIASPVDPNIDDEYQSAELTDAEIEETEVKALDVPADKYNDKVMTIAKENELEEVIEFSNLPYDCTVNIASRWITTFVKAEKAGSRAPSIEANKRYAEFAEKKGLKVRLS